MTLNRNVDNVFAETEQAAFHPGFVVPGIDFTNDPLLQGRLFSYTDTQLIRLGGPNFHEIPINRPICPFHNNQRDGYHRQTINIGKVSYHKNSLAGNTPSPANEEEGGYKFYEEKVEGRKIQQRSESFKDHFSQARLFWNSMSKTEKKHIIEAFRFELGKVNSLSVRQQVVDMFANVSLDLVRGFAPYIGVEPPQKDRTAMLESVVKSSPALSQQNTVFKPDTRKVAVLATNGFNGKDVLKVLNKLKEANIQTEIVSESFEEIIGKDGIILQIDETFLTTDAVLYDTLYIVAGRNESKHFNKETTYFVYEAFNRSDSPRKKWLEIEGVGDCVGIVMADDMSWFSKEFIEAITVHRHWERDVL